MTIQMTEMQKSALQEAGNIGSGHAAISLSQLMGRKIMIAIPSVEVYGIEKHVQIINGKGQNIIQIKFSVTGGARGVIFFILEQKMAMSLCDIVMGELPGNTAHLGEMEQSALKEIGSILSASYLNAISEMTELSLLLSTPEYNFGEILLIDKILAKKEINIAHGDEILCIKTGFIEVATKIEAYLVFAPSHDAIEKMLSRLGV